MRKISILTMVAIVLAASLVAGSLTNLAFAEKKSPYESGYDHGCDDAFIEDVDDRYINQKEKGPKYHTNEFMRGYNNGYDACSDEESQEENSWVTNQAQQQTQTNKCGNFAIFSNIACSNEQAQGQNNQ